MSIVTKKFIFVPVVNHFELLEKAVRSISAGLFDEYIIFNNSSGEIPEQHYSGTPFRVWTPEVRKTFRETQNIMRQYAIDNKFDYYSFMHNDGEVVDGVTDKLLIEEADKFIREGVKWSVIFTAYDVFCAFNTEAFEKTGVWGDDEWPADQHSGYHLDCDYYRRVRLAGYPTKNIRGSGVTHTEYSNTIRTPEERERWVSQQHRVWNHYKRKWGGDPNKETFNVPFGPN
jgi:GT2 family glycosyltransferase